MKASSTLSQSSTHLPHINSRSSDNHSTPAIIPLDYNYQAMAPSSSLSTSLYHPSKLSTVTGGPNATDVHYTSLFGDPVPPPPRGDFFGSEFSDALTFSRRPSMIPLSSEDGEEDEAEEEEGFLNVRNSSIRHLFLDTPYSSAATYRPSNAMYAPRLQPPDIQILPNSSGASSSEPRDSPNYALLTPDDAMRRPSLYEISEPENGIKMLETVAPDDSDVDGHRKYSEATRRVSSFSEDFKSNVGSLGSPPPDVPKLSTMYMRQFSTESYSSSEWFRPSSHRLSSSLMGSYPEFSKMPCLRPSSKNVMSIKNDEMPMHHSPVAAMINDSNESSSGEERLMDKTVVLERPTLPAPIVESRGQAKPTEYSTQFRFEDPNSFLHSTKQFLQQRRRTSDSSMESEKIFPLPVTLPSPPPRPPLPASPPPPLPLSPPPRLPDEPPPIEETTNEKKFGPREQKGKRDASPVIIRDAVAVGGDFRVDQARLHKKASFTIISDKTSTPQSSRAQSPAQYHHKSQTSPFLGYGFKESAIPSPKKAASSPLPVEKSLRQKSLSSNQLKLPELRNQFMCDDFQRSSTVQFNMTGPHSPSKMSQKGILQHRGSASSFQELDSAETTTLQQPAKATPSTYLAYDQKMKSCEMLPLITDPYRTAIPRLNRSSLDLRRESATIPPGSVPRPLRPNPNPTRKQPGLLRVINSADSLSRIPLRSNWASLDDIAAEQSKRKPSLSPLPQLPKGRRRSSSSSPERRSSTQTASDRRSSNLSSITTSDFSFRRPSLTFQQPLQHSQRRKSIIPQSSPSSMRRPSVVASGSNMIKGNRTPRNRIVKPTTLSPIIGTPNKESSSPQSPAEAPSLTPSDIVSDAASRRGSQSKIPVRNDTDSRSNSRMSSRTESRRGSRSSSPLKDFVGGMHLPLSGLTSRAASSRSPSRATTRTDSRTSLHVNSQGPSRSISRASTNIAISRGPSRPSSRMEEAISVANSRSNSRLSQRSVQLRTGSVSPSNGRKRKQDNPLSRRKSISLSPKINKRILLPKRRGSLSPDQERRIRGSKKSPEKQRRNSRSKIPTRAGSGPRLTRKESQSKSKRSSNSMVRRNLQSPEGSQPRTSRKEPSSAKKVQTSVQKPTSSVKRTPSSVRMLPTAAKKQPSSLQKTSSDKYLKRETSNVQKKAGTAPTGSAKATGSTRITTTPSTAQTLKKESSALSLKAGSAGQTKAHPKGQTKTDTTGQTKAGAAGQTKSDPEGQTKVDPAGQTPSGPTPQAKRLSTGIGALAAAAKVTTAKKSVAGGDKETKTTPTTDETQLGTTSAAGDVTNAIAGSNSRPPASKASLQRQSTKLRLLRAGSKLSLLSAKGSDGNLSRKLNAETNSIAEESVDVNAQQDGGGDDPTDNLSALPAAVILEKSQKTLENVQKTVTEATDEIQKTISENLTDLKSLESDMSRVGGYESAASPSPSVATVVENKVSKAVTRNGIADGAAAISNSGTLSSDLVKEPQKSPAPPTQPIEAAVSVINEVASSISAIPTQTISHLTHNAEHATARNDGEAAERNYELGIDDFGIDGLPESHVGNTNGRGGNFKVDSKRRSPDGQGGSTAGSGDKASGISSHEYLGEKLTDEEDDNDFAASKRGGCCSCCTRLCMPCRRSRCSRCCRRKNSNSPPSSAAISINNNNNNKNNHDEARRPVLSTTTCSATSTRTTFDVVDERKASCWQKLSCCRKKQRDSSAAAESPSRPQQQQQQQQQHMQEEQMHSAGERVAGAQQSSKCGLCLSKVFCCRSVNKVKTTTSAGTSTAIATDAGTERRKCCFCIPCCRRRSSHSRDVYSTGSGSAAWQDPEAGIVPTDASVVEGADAATAEPQQGCCRRFCNRLFCCRKAAPAAAAGSRRASMKAAQPAEETRRKLHVDLVEYNSKMKGAIPVLPLYLAWFCVICNTVVPGLGGLNELRLIFVALSISSSPSRHHLLRHLLCVRRYTEVLALRQRQGSPGFSHYQHDRGSRSVFLCSLLLRRLGLVHLVGYHYAEMCEKVEQNQESGTSGNGRGETANGTGSCCGCRCRCSNTLSNCFRDRSRQTVNNNCEMEKRLRRKFNKRINFHSALYDQFFLL